MLARSFRALALLLLAALVHLPSFAEDTDLFASPNAVAASNILVVFDNAASFSASASQACSITTAGVVKVDGTGTSPTNLSGTAGGVEQCALYAALSSLAANNSATFNIGFMMFNAAGLRAYDPSAGAFSDCPSSGDGGCLMVPMTPYTPDVKTNILDWIRRWDNSGNGNYNIKVNNLASGAVMQEAWAYYKGKTGISGKAYTAPSVGCGKNFVIYVGNAYRNNTSPSDQTGTKGPKQYLNDAPNAANLKYASPAPTTREKTVYSDTVTAKYGLGASQIICTSGSSSSYTFTGSENAGEWGLNWSLYMYNEHDIKTTSIGLLGAACLPSYSAFLQRLAEAGGGDFYATNDYSTMKTAFQAAIGNIIAVNSVFASVSLPVSVNTQGSYLNQVFVGMFRPDDSFMPRWYGNLKQYKLAFTSGDTLKLVDADTNAAINTNTGFIKECARSYWTPTSTTGELYWAASQRGSCTTVADSDQSDYPDGNIVEKGAQAYMLRKVAPADRVVKTCGNSLANCASWSDFNTTTPPAASLFGSGLDNTARDTLINWARGQNSLNELTKGTTVMRPSVHGDVMHSRPVAVNHGTDNAPSVVVYYGANDGMLHAINGNQSASISSTNSAGTTVTYVAGQELWSFMPPEFYGNIKRLYDNTVPVYYKGTQADGATTKPYGMDGPLVAFSGRISGTPKNYIFAAMRRGGRALYAFDVTTAGNPSLLWKKGCSSASLTATDCGSGTSDYSAIGQTWSGPKVFYAQAYDSGNTPLLLMGGGYDTCEDTDGGSGNANHACTSSTTARGNRVYVIDATDGHIVKEFQTVAPFANGVPRGVVGEPTIVNVSGKAKYAYIADLGGVVYRISFPSSNVNNWDMTPIAKLGCSSAAACTANRKFMFQPSVVSTDGSLFYILLGSGDREKPTTQYGASNGVSNYFFMIKDTPTDNGWLTDGCGSGNDFFCLSALQPITTATPDASVLAEKKGWYLALTSTEQVVTSAITQYGITTFSTHQPAVAAASCTNTLGTSRVYNISYKDASAVGDSRYDDLAGDGLPPSPVAGKVLINGTPVPFCIGCSPESPLEGKKATQLSGVSRAKSRLFWYLEKN